MKPYLPSHFIIAAFAVFFAIAGCAGYGKLSSPPGNEADALLADLLSRTDRYVVQRKEPHSLILAIASNNIYLRKLLFGEFC